MPEKCPNCGGDNYVNAPLVEACNDCGLACVYDGGGANAVYEEMMDRHAEEEEARRDIDRRAEEDRAARDGNDD